MIIALSLIAFVTSISIGFKWKQNIGCVAAVFAFLIGCFLLKLEPKSLIAFIPVKILFPLIGVTFFFGFAIENGTLNVLLKNVLYRFRNKTQLLPWLLFLTAILVSGSGLGAGNTVALLGPIATRIASVCGFNLLIPIVAISNGSAIGSNLPWSQGGIVIKELLNASIYHDLTTKILNQCQIDTVVVFSVVLLLVCLVFRKKTSPTELLNEEMAKLNPEQKKTAVLIMIIIILIVLPSMVNQIFPLPELKKFAVFFDIGFICMAGAVTASLLHLGDESIIIRQRIPWNTILMISGISMLTGVIQKAGVIEVLGNFAANYVHIFLIPLLLCAIACIMSLFSGAMSVVTPTLFALVPELLQVTGSNPASFYSAIVLGACLGGISPFSTGGSMLLGSCEKERDRERLIYLMAPLPFIMLALALLYLFIMQWLQ